jgi:hypothetical protein
MAARVGTAEGVVMVAQAVGEARVAPAVREIRQETGEMRARAATVRMVLPGETEGWEEPPAEASVEGWKLTARTIAGPIFRELMIPHHCLGMSWMRVVTGQVAMAAAAVTAVAVVAAVTVERLEKLIVYLVTTLPALVQAGKQRMASTVKMQTRVAPVSTGGMGGQEVKVATVETVGSWRATVETAAMVPMVATPVRRKRS